MLVPPKRRKLKPQQYASRYDLNCDESVGDNLHVFHEAPLHLTPEVTGAKTA